MSGQIKNLIDQIIEARAKGNPTIAATTKTKLLLKGINPNTFTDKSDDDPSVVAKIKAIAVDWGVTV